MPGIFGGAIVLGHGMLFMKFSQDIMVFGDGVLSWYLIIVWPWAINIACSHIISSFFFIQGSLLQKISKFSTHLKIFDHQLSRPSNPRCQPIITYKNITITQLGPIKRPSSTPLGMLPFSWTGSSSTSSIANYRLSH